MNFKKECRLHMVGNGSLRVTIPREIARAFRLKAQDTVIVEANDSGVTLNFLRVTTTPAFVQQEEAAPAT
jgi:bifunctional DNA-binding transcriptional regulator/antitoxin component of YhaV-PrlF toxin-antitoxin module